MEVMLSRDTREFSRGASVSLLNVYFGPLNLVGLPPSDAVDGVCLSERMGELALLAGVASRSSQLMRLASSLVAAAASETESTASQVSDQT